MNVRYEKGEQIQPLQEIKNNTLVIHLSSQYQIDQEEKKLEIAQKTFNDPLIDKQYKAFHHFSQK